MTELEQIIKMLDRAEIKYESDSYTYPGRIVVRTYSFSMAKMKEKITAIFDFTPKGELLSIG